ncbi:MAG: isoprenylcysteine carboxylmethyltransferase family protein [Spirosomataceae bacterium]
MSPYFLQISLWLAYGALHSVLASSTVKQFLALKLGRSFRYYRLIYNLLAFGLLVGLWLYQRILPTDRLWAFDWRLDILADLLKLSGLVTVFFALKGYYLGEFVGLKTPQQAAQTNFRSSGLLQYVRHPIYSGTILFVLGLFWEEATIRSLIMVLCVIVYIRIGIVFEEQKLVRQFEDTYLDYRRRVPMLWPNFYQSR